jgi:hypothetical protein
MRKDIKTVASTTNWGKPRQEGYVLVDGKKVSSNKVGVK